MVEVPEHARHPLGPAPLEDRARRLESATSLLHQTELEGISAATHQCGRDVELRSRELGQPKRGIAFGVSGQRLPPDPAWLSRMRIVCKTSPAASAAASACA